MVQTRAMKINAEKDIKNKEKLAVEALIEISESTPKETIVKIPKESNILEAFTNEEINNARLELAREYCRNKINKYDLPIPELVKYCPYHGDFDSQVKQSLKNKNMNVYHALQGYRNNMEKYESVKNDCKNNFNNIIDSFSASEILKYIEKKNKNNCVEVLEEKKRELKLLKEIKNLKELISVRQEIVDINNRELSDLKSRIETLFSRYHMEYRSPS